MEHRGMALRLVKTTHSNMFAASKSGSVSDPTDSKFNYVTMLLHGNGTNGAQNNTFLDSSTNNFTITRNGNTTQGTFTPYGSNWSNYFDGSGDYLSTASNSALAVGMGAFTAEAWIYPNTINNYAQIIGQTVNSNSYWMFCLQSNGAIRQQNYTVVQISSPSGAIVVGKWQHVVLVRDASSNIAIFVNGTRVASGTDSTNWQTNSVNTIGASTPDAGYHNGYISNARLVKGSAVYDPTLSTLTVPTTPLTAITNTSLLTCQSNRFIDNSTNNFTITKNGDVSVQRFSPFSPTTAYSTSVIGGSGYFDGTGDYLSTSSSIGSLSGNFTIECWSYLTASGSYPAYWTLGDSKLSTGLELQATATNIYLNSNNGLLISGASTTPLYTWNHWALVRSGSTVTLYKNGVSFGTATSSATFSGVFYSGAEFYNGSIGSANLMYGYISDSRVVNGTAVYTSAFTPPTAPLTAITNTSLLLSYTNAGILDNAMMNDLETVGNAQISTSVKKYGTGSISFDGTGDWLASPYVNGLNDLNGDFTIEFWIYFNSQASITDLVGTSNNQAYLGSGKSGWIIGYRTATGVCFSYQSNSSWVFDTAFGTSISTTTWTHIAIVRSGSTISCYKNGTASGTTITSSAALISNTYGVYVGVGAGNQSLPLNGYIDDLRITKGFARYTSNFTAPTAAFADKG